MRKINILIIISIISLLCACNSEVNDERTLKEALPEPISVWVKASVKVSKEDIVTWKTAIFDIDSEKEFLDYIDKYKIDIRQKTDFDFNKTFFKKNKLYLILIDGMSMSMRGELESFTVDESVLHINFRTFQNTLDADLATCGYFVAVSRETVKSIKSVENIKVEYLH
jgi:hypothetical protein